MVYAYLMGSFGSGLAPDTVPPPAPVGGHVTIRYTRVLQDDRQLIPIAPIRLPIVDGVLCHADGSPSTWQPIAVQATDDPALKQIGVRAQIDITFDNGGQPVRFFAPLPAGETINIATLGSIGAPGDVFVHGMTPAQLSEVDAAIADVTAKRDETVTASMQAEADRGAAERARIAAETARELAEGYLGTVEAARDAAQDSVDGAAVYAAQAAASAAEADARLTSAVSSIQGRMTGAELWPDPAYPGFFLFAPDSAGLTPDPENPGFYIIGGTP